jgi:hypothetical protein
MPPVRRPGQQITRKSTPARTLASRTSSGGPNTLSFAGLGTTSTGVPATRTIGTTTSAVKYIAARIGTAGNSVRTAHVVAGNNTALSVTVSGNDVTVNLATNGSGTATSTALDVAAAVHKSTAARALLAPVETPGAGTGVATASALANLTGGAN